MKNTLIFLGGAAVGGLAATLYFKRKIVALDREYEEIMNEEINKYINGDYDNKIQHEIVKEYFNGDRGNEIVKEYFNGDHGNEIQHEIKECAYKIIDQNICQEIKEENGYIHIDSETDETIDTDDENEQVAPYIITPDEYGDDEHATRTLTAFTDKVILDEDNCLFDTNYFGKDIMKTIYSKKNVDSSIFVRDDNDKIDYEIIKEKISFEDFTKLTESDDK